MFPEEFKHIGSSEYTGFINPNSTLNNFGYRVGYDFNTSSDPDIIIVGDSDTVQHNKGDYKFYHTLNEHCNVWTLCDFKWSNEQIEHIVDIGLKYHPNAIYIIQVSFLSRTGTVNTDISENDGIPTVKSLVPVQGIIDLIKAKNAQCLALPAANLAKADINIYASLFKHCDIKFINFNDPELLGPDDNIDYIDDLNHAGDKTNKVIYKLINDNLPK